MTITVRATGPAGLVGTGTLTSSRLVETGSLTTIGPFGLTRLVGTGLVGIESLTTVRTTGPVGLVGIGTLASSRLVETGSLITIRTTGPTDPAGLVGIESLITIRTVGPTGLVGIGIQCYLVRLKIRIISIAILNSSIGNSISLGH